MGRSDVGLGRWLAGWRAVNYGPMSFLFFSSVVWSPTVRSFFLLDKDETMRIHERRWQRARVRPGVGQRPSSRFIGLGGSLAWSR